MSVTINNTLDTFSTVSGSGSSLLTGLVSYWKLNEASGTGTAADSYGSNTGTVTGTVTQSDTGGKLGGSVTFGGYPNGISVGDPSNLRLTTAGSISVWYYPTSITGYRPIVSKGNYTNDRDGYILCTVTSRLRGEVCSATNSQNIELTTSLLVADTWQHCVFTWDASFLCIYRNTNKYSVAATPITPNSGVYGLYIGRDPVWETGVLGGIDEVGIWSRALTETEVGTLYNSGTGITYPFS